MTIEIISADIFIFIAVSDTVTKRHEARVTAYIQSSGTVTFTPAYSAVIASEIVFAIRPSFQIYIDNAFNGHVIRDIRNHVQSVNKSLSAVAGGYIDSTIVNTLTIYKTLELYCFSQVESKDDKWDVRAAQFSKNYSDELSRLFEPFDKDNDGNISSSEDSNRQNFANIRLRR